MPDKQTFHTVVIGSGPGGYVAAIRLAQLNKQKKLNRTIAIVERAQLGGVCLNWGCIPSKALIYAGSLLEKIQTAGKLGIQVSGDVTVDMPTLQTWKNGVVSKLTGGVKQLLKMNGVTVIEGNATFTDAHTLSIQPSEGAAYPVSFENALIATGSRSIELPGMAFDRTHILTSKEAVNLDAVPKTLAIIGGGVIGLELGMMYKKLGAEVTVIEALDQVLPGMDAEIVQVLNRALRKQKLNVMTQTKTVGAEVQKDGFVRLKLSTGHTLDVEKVLVAVGRRPNTENLGLDKAGVKLTERGHIPVDNQCRTSQPHIFAIGDVTPGMVLAHRASKEGLVAAAVISGEAEIIDYRALPAAVFTDPEIAVVGLTEAQATEQGLAVNVAKFPFQASGKALSTNEADGFVKVVAEKQTDRLLGVQMVGPHVSDLIAEAALAIEMRASAEDIALTVHAHPTLPESFMEAAEAIHQQAIHIYQG